MSLDRLRPATIAAYDQSVPTNPDPAWTPLPASRLLALLWRSGRVLTEHLDPILETTCGMGRREFMVLNAIRGGARYPSHVAAALQMPRDMTSRSLHQLDAAGLVERTLDEHDSRRTALALTPLGEERREAVKERLARTVQAALDRLGEEERDRLLDGLETFTGLLAEEMGERS